MNYEMKGFTMSNHAVMEHYFVVEKATGQTIKRFDSKAEAKKFLRHMNFGGGFDGWTPEFFLRAPNISLQSCE